MGFGSFPGEVWIVRLKLLGLLFGGVGGLMNDGEVGAEVFFSFLASTGNEADGLGPRRFVSEVDVLMPRFFRFRGFLAGVVGR
jgi:hypothetical protein